GYRAHESCRYVRDRNYEPRSEERLVMFKDVLQLSSKKPLIVIDPDLTGAAPIGHHWSTFQELRQLSLEQEIPIVFYGNTASGDLETGVRKHFDLGTYLTEAEITQWNQNKVPLNSCYQRLSLPEGCQILMHTASPWHLEGLIQLLKRRKDLT